MAPACFKLAATWPTIGPDGRIGRAKTSRAEGLEFGFQPSQNNNL